MNKPKKPTKIDFEARVNELTEDIKRIQADFINFKRRSEEDLDKRAVLGQQLAVSALLPTIDNLQRATANLPEELAENAWTQGVTKAAEQLMSDMEKIGLRKIETVGKAFDPNLMDAVSVEGDGSKSNKEIVSEEIQPGYMFNQDVLRHATVKVERK